MTGRISRAEVTATGTTTPRSLADRLGDIINVRDFESLVVDDDWTVAIQAGIDLSALTGKTLYGRGVFNISASGDIGGNKYCLLMKSNCTLDIDRLRMKDNQNASPIRTDSRILNTNIKISHLVVDGNEPNNNDSLSGVWFSNCYLVDIGYIRSYNNESFGVRFDKCDELTFDRLIAYNQGTEYSANDGVHFYDCNDVTGNTIFAASAGDDAVAITADSRDVSNISIANILCRSTNKGGAAEGGRGVLINLGDVAPSLRTISNVSLPSIVAENYGNGSALLLQNGDFENITATVTAIKCQNGLDLNVGGGQGFSGGVRNCNFNITDKDSVAKSVSMSVNSGAIITSNRLVLNSYNSGDGTGPVTLRGDKWTADLSIDCDPNGTKINSGFGVDVFGSYSDIKVTVFDSDVGINLRNGSSDNNIEIGTIESINNSIIINSNANNNSFTGGRINNTVTDNATGTAIDGVRGATSKGIFSGPISTGTIQVPHGLVQTPLFATGAARIQNPYIYIFNSADATDIFFDVYSSVDGTLVTTGNVFLSWEASIK